MIARHESAGHGCAGDETDPAPSGVRPPVPRPRAFGQVNSVPPEKCFAPGRQECSLQPQLFVGSIKVFAHTVITYDPETRGAREA
jgi:hypothetical protein